MEQGIRGVAVVGERASCAENLATNCYLAMCMAGVTVLEAGSCGERPHHFGSKLCVLSANAEIVAFGD